MSAPRRRRNPRAYTAQGAAHGTLSEGPVLCPSRVRHSPCVVFEGRSARGRLVRQTHDCNDYFGASPYFTVAYGIKVSGRGGAAVLRYTPHPSRAEALRRQMLLDCTDPAQLAMSVVDEPRDEGLPERARMSSLEPLVDVSPGLAR